MKALTHLLLLVIGMLLSISAQPTTPTGLSHSVALDGSSILLSWDDNADEDGYILRHTWIVDDPEGPNPQPGVFYLDSNITEFEYSLAKEGEKYSFQLSAYNGDGESDYASLVVVSTPRVEVTQSGESMTVTWDKIIGAQMYEVSIGVVTKRNTTGPSIYHTTDNYLFSAANCGYPYRVFVSVIGEDFPQSFINKEPVWIFIDCDIDQDPPLAPTNLKVMYTQKGALLRWDDNSDNEEGFWINKVVQRSGAPSTRGWIHVSASKEEYLDEDVLYGSMYSYTISAYNEGGWSYPSRYMYQHALPGVEVISLDLYDSNNIRIVWIDTIDYIKKEYYLLYWSPEDEDGFFNVDSVSINAEAVNFPSGFCGKNSFYMTSVFSINGKQYESLPSDTVWITITDPSICGITNVDEETPYTFTLHQNYPNPFNPSTSINYNIPSAGHVTLKVYDVLGSKIETLVDDFQEIGNHVVQFDGSSLPSSIYFYTLETQAYRETKKMILVK